jgi:FkbM family methyltransferase
MIRSDAKSWPPNRYIRKFHRRILELRQWLTREIHIVDGQADYRFRCETVREFNRCLKCFSREPGTFEWITQNVQPGDIFYDIGANIGVYTILAASRTGRKGRVYAFEPHGANFARLVDNIVLNSLPQVVVPSSLALHDKEGFFPFNYRSSMAGTSNSHLSDSRDPARDEYQPQISELKYATTIDRLIASCQIKAPHHVKIDVDGDEIDILRGMSHLLTGPSRPRSVQIEMNDPQQTRILEFMKGHRYRLSRRHYTRSSLRRIEKGGDAEAFSYNAIFHCEG